MKVGTRSFRPRAFSVFVYGLFISILVFQNPADIDEFPCQEYSSTFERLVLIN